MAEPVKHAAGNFLIGEKSIPVEAILQAIARTFNPAIIIDRMNSEHAYEQAAWDFEGQSVSFGELAEALREKYGNGMVDSWLGGRMQNPPRWMNVQIENPAVGKLANVIPFPESAYASRATTPEPASAISEMNTAAWAGPLGALVAIFGFGVMPYAFRNGVKMTGMDIANEHFTSFWVVPLAAFGILALFGIFMMKRQLKQAAGSTSFVSVMAMGILCLNYYIATTEGILSHDFRSRLTLAQLGIEIGPGGYITMLGFFFSIVGATAYVMTDDKSIARTKQTDEQRTVSILGTLGTMAGNFVRKISR